MSEKPIEVGDKILVDGEIKEVTHIANGEWKPIASAKVGMKRINAKAPNIDGKLGDVVWCPGQFQGADAHLDPVDATGNIWIFGEYGWIRLPFIPQLTFEAANALWTALSFAFSRTFLENEVTDGN